MPPPPGDDGRPKLGPEDAGTPATAPGDCQPGCTATDGRATILVISPWGGVCGLPLPSWSVNFTIWGNWLVSVHSSSQSLFFLSQNSISNRLTSRANTTGNF